MLSHALLTAVKKIHIYVINSRVSKRFFSLKNCSFGKNAKAFLVYAASHGQY